MAAPSSKNPGALSRKAALSYGIAGFGENLVLNSVAQLAFPVFNIILGVSPVLVGLALAIPRIWDAFTDIWMGSFSDNFSSRWGRRIPFIIGGAIATAMVMACIWWLPTGQSELFYFWWLLIGSMILTSAYTVFSVPLGALGMEMTDDYHERTKVMAIKAAFAKGSGIVNQWLFKLIQLGSFSSMLVGAKTLGIVAGAVVCCCGLITGINVKERAARRAAATPAIPLFRSLRETFRQRDFILLSTAQLVLYMSVLMVDNLGFYLNVYYVHGGDLSQGALLKGLGGTAFQVGGILVLPALLRLTRRIGKKKAYLFCTASIMVAGAAKWFCFVPGAGFWLILPSLLLAPGLVAVGTLTPSMMADICTADEARTGTQRAGMYFGVSQWLLKISVSITSFASGLLLAAAGWDGAAGAAQSGQTYLWLRVFFTGFTVLLAFAALLLIARYSLNQAEVERLQASRPEPDAAPVS